MRWDHYGFRPYVSVGERQRQAQRELAKLARKGLVAQPIRIDGRTIAASFWGKAWCDNLESYMDYANRLPRGRTYVRNGSVVHLEISARDDPGDGSGSELYRVKIQYHSGRQAEVERPLPRVRGRDRVAGRIAPGPPLRPGHGHHHAQTNRAVPRAAGSQDELFLPGLGGNVQAYRGGFLRHRSPAGPCAGTSLRVAVRRITRN